MNINVFAADERVLGKYSKVVEQIRDSDEEVSDEMLIKILKITPEFLQCAREAIAKYPDWDDEDIADYVIAETAED